MSAFVAEPITVRLGDQTFAVCPIKWKYLLPLKREIQHLFNELNEVLDVQQLIKDFTAGNGKVRTDAVFDALTVIFTSIGPMMHLAIPQVPIEIFTEEAADEASPDLPQVIDAFNAILKANHLEYVKNLFAVTTAPQNGAMTTPSPNSAISTDTPPIAS